MNNKHLEELLYRAELLKQDVRDEFGNLTAFQLNWKPAPEVWSIAQCLEHIIKADTSYLPELDKIISGKYSRPFWSRIPGKPKMWGKVLLTVLDKSSSQKVVTPSIFRPSEEKFGENLIDDFLRHEERVITYLHELDEVDYTKYYLRSPLSKYITYSLRDLSEITLLHQERHYRQAKALIELEKFPKTDKQSG